MILVYVDILTKRLFFCNLIFRYEIILLEYKNGSIKKCRVLSWLASPGVCVYSSNARFGPGVVFDFAGTGRFIFLSNGNWFADRFAVRPVVSLKSDVTTAEVKKLDNQNVTEDTWIGYSTSWSANGSESNGEAGNH